MRSSFLFRLASCIPLALVCLGQTSLAPGAREAVAVVGGQTIYEEDLAPLVRAQMQQIRNQEYEIKSRALDSLINQRLLDIEAKRKGLSQEQLLQQGVDSKVMEPTDGEIEAFYLAQRDRLNRPLSEIKTQLSQALRKAKIQNARQEYLRVLREKADVAILLQAPRIAVGFDASRVRGEPSAPVTIVEFSDFQCPYCQRTQITLREILAKYDHKVKLAFRDFPLREIHPRAQPAAEAARCAGEQGKFWEFHDLLFSDQSKLDAASLREHARSLELNMQQFESCLTSRRYESRVEADVQAGTKVGVSGTPAFFINGVSLSGAQPLAAFEKVIDNELAASGKGRSSLP